MIKVVKICSKCNEEKGTLLFVKNSNVCKLCKSLYMKQYSENNKSDIKLRKKKVYEDNKNIILTKSKEYYVANKEAKKLSTRLYYAENSKIIKEKKGKYYEANKEGIIRKNISYEFKRRKTDIVYRLRKDTSKVISIALRLAGGSKDGQSVMNYLPYSIQDLKIHLEKQFESWMNWNNRGSYIKNQYNNNDKSTWTWNIDYIIPQSTLPYTSMEDDNFKKCWALSNLRPLKSIDNLKKGSKFIS